MATVIDAHQHFWELGRFDYDWLQADGLEPIRRSFLPRDLQPLLTEAGVDYAVFVQTQHHLAENRWVLELTAHYPFLAGVVGWVDLSSPACEDQLLEFLEQPKFVGVRHVTHDEPDVDFIVRPEVIRGLKVLERHNVPFDLLFRLPHLKHAITLARALPNLRMVVDHLAKPSIKLQRMDDWRETLCAAAAFPNLYCKLSGMITEADWQGWQPSDLKPYVDVALEAFGPARCMYGSDWPVCNLAGSYRQVIDALRENVARLSEHEQQAIWGETARQFYRLELPRSP